MTTFTPRETIKAFADMVAAAAAAGHTVAYCSECGDYRRMVISTTPDDRMALDFHALRNHTNYAHGRMVAIFGR